MTDVDPRALLHLASIVESSDDAIISKDLDGTIRSWNSAAERLFGFTAQEAIGRSIRMIIPADRQSEEDDVLARLGRGEPIRHFETIRQRKDGTQVPVSLSVSPVRDDTGRVIGASKIARDISEHHRAVALAQQLGAIVESSDDAIISKSLDSTIRSWNRAAERLFGYTAAEAVGKSIRMIIPAELQAEEDVVLARIRAGQIVDHFETRRRRKDGSELNVSLTVSPLRDEKGTVIGASKIARDVTEQLRLRRVAQEHASLAETLAEVGASVTSSLDQQTIVQRVTDVATDLIGAEFGAFFYNVTEPSGKSYMLYTLSGASKSAFANFPQPRATALFAPTFHGEGIVRLDDVTADPRFGKNPPFHGMPPGHPGVRSYLAVPVKSIGGPVLGGLFFGHSKPGLFTEAHQRLVGGIATWATLSLENSRLFADAQQADRLKDEFLAVLSHELRTPLNAIVGYSRLLRGGLLNGEKADRGLETLERNAHALTQIVEDVLDISRIVSGKIRLDVQPVDLATVVQDALATVQPAADAKHIRVQTLLDPRVSAVSGDPERLQQAVWNLFSNAVKFTPKDGRVQVRVERINSHVELSVSDTGRGIAPDFIEHVFERFRQADAGPTRRTGGLGLGLAIVRQIVEMHGGTVSAASDGEGKGATFRIALPVMVVHHDAVSPARENPTFERLRALTDLHGLHGIRVMTVDDDQDALGLLRVVLETAGAEVIAFSSAVAALGSVSISKPDALVVDLGMPSMDGFEFIARLRQSVNPQIRDIPAAALTAFARSEDRAKALRSGFQLHLSKPVDPAELVAAIGTLVKRWGPSEG